MPNPSSIKDKLNELAKGKPVAIFGCGVSGLAAEKLLDVYSIKSIFYEEPQSKGAGEKKSKIFDAQAAEKHSLVVYSPAFRPDHPWLELARSQGAECLCEPDLAALAWCGRTIAVTGTNGKTTVTKFITHVLNECGFTAFSAGNIGSPLSDFCAEFAKDGKDVKNFIAVCELSSFQTINLSNFKCEALIWTNFAPDHLDWHKSMREYFDAKFKLLQSVQNKIFISDRTTANAATKYGYQLPSFVDIMDFDSPEMREYASKAPAPFDTSIQSKNYLMVAALFKKLGIDESKVRACAQSFELPSYRFGNFIKVGKVRFYNDSKATNAHAAIAALKDLDGTPNLIWLGGGKDKFCELSDLCAQIRKSAIAAVLIGQTAEKLSSLLQDLPKGAIIAPDMDSAVKTAYEMLCKQGGSVLFSPAFSSFGMFSGYVERGKSFENSVLCLKNLKE